MQYTYKASGICSRSITFELEDGIIRDIHFEGGCDGNLQGISRLITGQRAEDVIECCKGIRCGYKTTSCPDQLSIALRKALNENDNSIKNHGVPDKIHDPDEELRSENIKN